MPRNPIHEHIGEEWGRSYFNPTEQGYHIYTRNHHTEKNNPDHEYEDITLNKDNAYKLIEKLQKLRTREKYLLIVRTFRKNQTMSPSNCYFIHVSLEKIVDMVKKQGYFSIAEEDYPEPGSQYVSKDKSISFHLIKPVYLKSFG